MPRISNLFTIAVSLLLAACGRDEGSVVATIETPGEANVSLAGGLDPAAPGPAPASPAVRGVTSFTEAEVAYREGKIEEAHDFFTGYVAIKPENPWGHYMLGLTQWRQGELSAAAKAFDQAIALDSLNPKAFFNSGRVLLGLGRPHEAFERIERGLAIDTASADGLRLLARAHAALDNVDGALETYRRALVRAENDVWTLNNLGMLYLETGNPESALGPLARAVQLRPTSPIFHNNLGVALERAGHPLTAKRAFEEATRVDSTYAKARKNLDRLTLVVTDSTPAEKLVIADLAEEFRLQVGMWKDSAPQPPRPAVDSLPPQ
jgi:predicted Zn-dependent protease